MGTREFPIEEKSLVFPDISFSRIVQSILKAEEPRTSPSAREDVSTAKTTRPRNTIWSYRMSSALPARKDGCTGKSRTGKIERNRKRKIVPTRAGAPKNLICGNTVSSLILGRKKKRKEIKSRCRFRPNPGDRLKTALQSRCLETKRVRGRGQRPRGCRVSENVSYGCHQYVTPTRIQKKQDTLSLSTNTRQSELV